MSSFVHPLVITCIVRMSPRCLRHLYCQDAPQTSQTLVLSGCLPDVSDTCIVRMSLRHLRHLYCQDVSQTSETLVLLGCPSESQTHLLPGHLSTSCRHLCYQDVLGVPTHLHLSAKQLENVKPLLHNLILYSITSLLCSTCHTNTSVMIHHCGTSLSKQQTDLSLHKTEFVTQK